MVATIVNVERTTNRYRVTMDVDFPDEFNQPEVEITIGKPKNKRSKDANAYFHVLVGKIADKCRMSKIHCKNIMLARYGQYEFMDGKRLVISVDSDVDMANREDIHCSAIGYGEVNGKKFTHYAVMKPSHEYDSKEMAHLIDGTVDEAKELGIEVLTPDEIERMKALWK